MAIYSLMRQFQNSARDTSTIYLVINALYIFLAAL